VAGLAQDGFDGVYLDWVEAYDDSVVLAGAARQGIDPEEAMMSFIEKIRQAGRSVREDFLVVPQNAPYLIDHDPARYVDLIDGLAVEDTWFSGTGDAEWDDPAGGDIPNENSDEYSTNNLLNQYKKYLQRGLPVFSVDYCLNPANAQRVYREARKAGLRPLVTRVALSRITSTPPPDN
jgi:cysteinyl-tRNA synthetase